MWFLWEMYDFYLNWAGNEASYRHTNGLALMKGGGRDLEDER